MATAIASPSRRTRPRPRRWSPASGGAIVPLSDEEILASWRELAELEGLFCEPASRCLPRGRRQAAPRFGRARDLRHHRPRPQGPGGGRPPLHPTGVGPGGSGRDRGGGVVKVTVRAPATTANLGAGFDCAAVALDLWNSSSSPTAGPPTASTWEFRRSSASTRPTASGSSGSTAFPASAASLERVDHRARPGRRCAHRRPGARPGMAPLGGPAAGGSPRQPRGCTGRRSLHHGGRADRAPCRRRPAGPNRPRALLHGGDRGGARRTARAGALGDAVYAVGRAVTLGAALATRSEDLFCPSPTGSTSPIGPSTRRCSRRCARTLPPGARGAISGSGPTVIVWAEKHAADDCAV